MEAVDSTAYFDKAISYGRKMFMDSATGVTMIKHFTIIIISAK
jgi:hypothetical protein